MDMNKRFGISHEYYEPNVDVSWLQLRKHYFVAQIYIKSQKRLS